MWSFAILRLHTRSASVQHYWWRNQLPPLHVWLNIQKILEANTPWLAGSSFEHEAPELGMEDRSSCLIFPATVNIIFPIRNVVVLISLDGTSFDIWHTASLVEQLLIVRQRSQDVRLSERKSDLAVLLIVRHHEVLDLFSRLAFGSPACSEAMYLVSPEQCVSFFAFGVPPYSEQLLVVTLLWVPATAEKGQGKPTSIPHSRTWPATFLASGHSSGVPMAL
jgi:hypothetical protein